MIFYLNKGRVLEEEIVKVIQNYFAAIDLANDYNGISVNVTNEHPFNILNGSSEPQAASLFPAVVVSTYEDVKPPKLANLPESGIEPRQWTWKEEDIDQLKEAGYDVTPQLVEKIKEFYKNRDELYGVVFGEIRQDRIAIEIFSDNIALKNQIYGKVMNFVCCMMKHIFDQGKEISIFDDSIYGRRSGEFNYDFGVSLACGQIFFEADYVIEQSVIDTEVDDGNYLLEVINHAKDNAVTTRSIIGIGATGNGESEGIAGNGESDGSSGDSEGNPGAEQRRGGKRRGERNQKK